MLKIIGIISMTIDHIGYLFFPELMWPRAVGRIAFPIFAYGISQGYIHTKDLKLYMYRLFIFAVISQLPYYFFISRNHLNAIFTLLLGLISLTFIDRYNFFAVLIPAAIAYLLKPEYGVYGILITVFFYYFGNNHKMLFLTFSIVTVIYSVLIKWDLQLLSLIVLPLILCFKNTRINVNKYIFYTYYPLHITVLGLIKIFMKG